jgi:hypothetical protein
MTERRADGGPTPGPDPYWQHDVAIEVPPSYDLTGGFGFRFKIHEGTERYGRSHEDLVRLTGPGTRLYFHGRPYQLLADHHLTVGLFSVPPPSGEIGLVEDVRWEGFKHQELGNAQGWYYPENRTLVLWECFLEERYRGGSPWDDTLNLIVWQAWERFLIEHSPGVDTLVTTWEDIYDREIWQLFLEGQGYRRVSPASFGKKVAGR